VVVEPRLADRHDLDTVHYGAVVTALRWSDRSLLIPSHRYSGRPVPHRLEPGSISVKGAGWAVDLPLERAQHADDYVNRLRAALEV
jgi:hypothetical protein